MKALLALASVNQTPLDWKGNFSRVVQAVEMAKEAKADFILLPELCLSGYGCEDMFFHPWIAEKAFSLLIDLLPYSKDIVIQVGLPFRFRNKLYNTQAILANGKIAGLVAKRILALEEIYYEPRWFTPWPSQVVEIVQIEEHIFPIGDLIFNIGGIRLGIEICEDAWHDNRPLQSMKKVQLVTNGSASHFCFGKSEKRRQMVEESARKFQVHYCYSNLVGNESGRIIYDGEQLLSGPDGLIFANEVLRFEEVQVNTVEVELIPGSLESGDIVVDFKWKDKDVSPSQKQIPKLLIKEESFYHAVTLGLWDYLRKSKSKGFTISLSGGADSSACTLLAVHALERAKAALGDEKFRELSGIEKSTSDSVFTVYQSTSNNSSQTFDSARMLAENLGVHFCSWQMDDFVSGYTSLAETALKLNLDWKTHDLALQNVQARVRVPALWMLANLTNTLLLATSNRSELAVGYTTMDGDAAGGLAPIAGVDKAFLRQWLIWAEANLSISGLRGVNSLSPSAELRPGLSQTDEQDLMPYTILNKIEIWFMEEHKTPEEIIQLLTAQNIEEQQAMQFTERFFTLWSRNQWKRERTAPAFHLDGHNLDPKSGCRFPILNGGLM